MISTADFIHLSFRRDLTEGGIAYALRLLPDLSSRRDAVYDRLRRLVAEAAVELAFRRYLSEQEIPFDVKAALPFTDKHQYDVFLSGRRCSLQSFFIRHREQALQIKRNPQVLLKAPALIASDQNAAEGRSNRDIYIFAFLPGLVTTSEEDVRKVMQTNQPYYFMHALPDSWARPARWHPLGKLVLKSDSEETIHLELGGRDISHELRTLEIEIPPKSRVEIEPQFFSLVYVRNRTAPDTQLGIHSPGRSQTYIVKSSTWENIWIYGLEIVLVGYLTREEFNRRASFVREGARVFQYDRTRTKNLAVDVCDLRPIADLIERVNE